MAAIEFLTQLIEPEVHALGFELVRVKMIGGTSDPTVAERTGRAQSVVDADAARYDRFSLPAMAAIPAGATGGGWARRRIEGKLLSIARLAKASLTYAGGIDYLAWKINRHAGTKIEIKPWQRRWPLVAALTLVPRLIKGGAIR